MLKAKRNTSPRSIFKRNKVFKKITALILWLVVFALKVYSQEIPRLDTLVLKNGLKVYLLQHGEDSVLTVRLVIHSGKRNETTCQVGYSEIIQQLLHETLKEKQKSILKKEDLLACELRDGKTILSGNCSTRDLNRKMEFLSATIAKLSFRHDKIHRGVSSITDSYTLKNISAQRLSIIYKNLILYGIKNPLGRNYCQYQLQKALPGELKLFYFKHYTPKSASLLICGNFNTNEVKKIITKQFDKWKFVHKKKETPKDAIDLKLPKIKTKEIAFINQRDAKVCLLKWVQSAPSSLSSDYWAFIVTCHLFDDYLASKIKEREGISDNLNFEPVTYTTDFMEINSITAPNAITKAIQLVDSTLQGFHQLKFTKPVLEEAVNHLKDQYAKNKAPETILLFYDPLVYHFESRKNYLAQLSRITVQDIQMILKKYFSTNSYKLIIVGDERTVSSQLPLLRNVVHYQTMDFETCDESCIVRSKKKWKKGRRRCCFQCFMRGWCPCMYSSARLQ